MARYIDADKITFEYDNNFRLVVPKHQMDNAPTEDVQPVVHAYWIKTEHKGYKCSLCNCLSSLFDENLKSVFCPWCGARMDKKEATYIKDIFMTR